MVKVHKLHAVFNTQLVTYDSLEVSGTSSPIFCADGSLRFIVLSASVTDTEPRFGIPCVGQINFAALNSVGTSVFNFTVTISSVETTTEAGGGPIPAGSITNSAQCVDIWQTFNIPSYLPTSAVPEHWATGAGEIEFTVDFSTIGSGDNERLTGTVIVSLGGQTWFYAPAPDVDPSWPGTFDPRIGGGSSVSFVVTSDLVRSAQLLRPVSRNFDSHAYAGIAFQHSGMPVCDGTVGLDTIFNWDFTPLAGNYGSISEIYWTIDGEPLDLGWPDTTNNRTTNEVISTSEGPCFTNVVSRQDTEVIQERVYEPLPANGIVSLTVIGNTQNKRLLENHIHLDGSGDPFTGCFEHIVDAAAHHRGNQSFDDVLNRYFGTAEFSTSEIIRSRATSNVSHVRHNHELEIVYASESALHRVRYNIPALAIIETEILRTEDNICNSPSLMLSAKQHYNSSGFRKILVWQEQDGIKYVSSERAIGFDTFSPQLLVANAELPACALNSVLSRLYISYFSSETLFFDVYKFTGITPTRVLLNTIAANVDSASRPTVLANSSTGELRIYFFDVDQNLVRARSFNQGASWSLSAVPPLVGRFDIELIPTLSKYLATRLDDASASVIVSRLDDAWTDLVVLDSSVDDLIPSLLYEEVSGRASVVYLKSDAPQIQHSYDHGRTWLTG